MSESKAWGFSYLHLKAKCWKDGSHITSWTFACPDPTCNENWKTPGSCRERLVDEALAHILGYHKYEGLIEIGYVRDERE